MVQQQWTWTGAWQRQRRADIPGSAQPTLSAAHRPGCFVLHVMTSMLGDSARLCAVCCTAQVMIKALQMGVEIFTPLALVGCAVCKSHGHSRGKDSTPSSIGSHVVALVPPALLVSRAVPMLIRYVSGMCACLCVQCCLCTISSRARTLPLGSTAASSCSSQLQHCRAAPMSCGACWRLSSQFGAHNRWQPAAG